MATYPHHEFQPDQPEPETLREAEDLRRYSSSPAPVVHMPIRFQHPLETRVRCADALNSVIERYGLSAVLAALSNVVAANGYDVCRQSINDVALELQR